MIGHLLTAISSGGCSVLLASCVVTSVCYNNADCPADKVCDGPPKSFGVCVPKCRSDSDCLASEVCHLKSGECKEAECTTDDDCPPHFQCIERYCVSRLPLGCAADMKVVENQFCIDIFEASRLDATAIHAGFDGSAAFSVAGVLPWQVSNNAEAQAACEASGKTLCSERHWRMACKGPDESTYSYGNSYRAATCNGIDKYCPCTGSSCEGHDPCPFPHCYQLCGAAFRLDPTGQSAGCTNSYGVFDMNGNLWEHVLDGDDTQIRGGAYNCSNSERLHRCEYIPSDWSPSARGFRCCNLGLPAQDDGAPSNDGSSDGGAGPDGGD